MADKIKIVFIVNPKAGITPKSKLIIELLAGNLLPSRFKASVLFTEYPGHATQLARNSMDQGADVIVAAGGDGTINEVAEAMQGSKIPMGILPSGSGNGLARCLGISMSYPLSLRTIIKGYTREIDLARINDRIMVSIAGVGFDAHVAEKFAGSDIRGLVSYARIILNEFRKYNPLHYDVLIDGKKIERNALMISFANSNQFGFHTRIAPEAMIDDGFLDVCVVKPIRTSQILKLGYHMLRGTLGRTGYAEYFRAKTIQILNLGSSIVNIDGEPVAVENEVNISIMPKSLLVIVP